MTVRILQSAQGILFVLAGIVSIVDGWRIATEARQQANFEAIGPDRYLFGLAALMLVGGLWRLLAHPGPAAESHRAVAAHATGTMATVATTVVMLAGFAALTPAIGFSLACLLFLIAQFALLSGWPWWKNIAVAAVAAFALHAAFIWFADMPLPKGYFWDADISLLGGNGSS
jgi:hypothetical protein